ncbi:basic leucine zipper 61-like [Argentina anserina]|uniref:basic leucine zipper 61-like n=1 Tax=Argentina anserina TaxID=57926 RepID=UPI0021766009|nr:basic leucine zipper 61-like [Potentilla anserina]
MAQLPPKIPSMTQNWAPFPHHRIMPSMANFLPSSAGVNHPPSSPPQQHQSSLCWMDEFLDFSSARRGAHRRSASDSIAFLESPLNVLDVDVDHCERNPTVHGSNNIAGSFDRLDDEQLMSMFSDDIAVPPAVTSSSNPSSPSDQNSNNDDNMNTNNNNGNMNNENANNNNVNGSNGNHRPMMNLRIDGHQQPKSEPGEVESSFDPNDPHSQSPRAPLPTSPADPKRVKRILANRQSAQRSRVRKLQYISELERSVTSLQSEVSALSPRVAFLDHQRLILNVDNSALKQRIAALAQDKLFKDAHQEALKKEIERLRQVYHHQTLKKMGSNGNGNGNNNNQNAAAAPPQQPQQALHHSPADMMLCTDHNKAQQQIMN